MHHFSDLFQGKIMHLCNNKNTFLLFLSLPKKINIHIQDEKKSLIETHLKALILS